MVIGEINSSTQHLQQFRLQENSTQSQVMIRRKENDVHSLIAKLEKAPTKMEIENVLSKLNEGLNETQTSIRYKLHEKLNELYVSIVDAETEEVIQEVPPKKLLDIYAFVAESLGLIVDHKI
ncbi:flagellar protein FlaG [Pontibacillus salicampi]|uniref:flagellar protein FlaG n=1 Tax=Pontibacillus salicampi TaxID=1449801 RepID=UPI00366C4E7F